MKICIQDPSWPDSVYLLEEIFAGCAGASHGAGVFAFASAGGVKLLFQDPAFADFLSESSFDLVIGVDAVTDTKALDALAANLAIFERLKVQAFLSNAAGLFHPKMCWFRHQKKGVSLVGSGNLTAGGLRGNCETFTVTEHENRQQAVFENAWFSWLGFHSKHLLPIDHPEIRKRASANTGVESGARGKKRTVIVEDNKGNISVGGTNAPLATVLIAEIPRSGDRWNQANFDLDTFQNFFGAKLGHTQRIILTHVGSDGRIGAPEVRPSVAVPSQNYRFELEAAAGLAYPSGGRPIAIFLKIGTRTFRYRLLMPGSKTYANALAFLKRHGPQRGNRVLRLTTNVEALSGTDFFAGLADDGVS